MFISIKDCLETWYDYYYKELNKKNMREIIVNKNITDEKIWTFEDGRLAKLEVNYFSKPLVKVGEVIEIEYSAQR